VKPVLSLKDHPVDPGPLNPTPPASIRNHPGTKDQDSHHAKH
jgi:hypothetical protein